MTAPGQTRLLRHAYACLICTCTLPTVALGQANLGSPPPSHLPRYIWECEIGAGASAGPCSIWIWQGSSYSATWSIGSTGQLTVSSEGNAEISVHRQDTSGNLAGLNATYTAKWDGSRFSDGKITFTCKGAAGTGVWPGAPLVTPVVHTLSGTVQTVTQDEIYGVGKRPAPCYNWYSTDLTGFAVHTDRFEGWKLDRQRRLDRWLPVSVRPSRPSAFVIAALASNTTWGSHKLLDVATAAPPASYQRRLSSKDWSLPIPTFDDSRLE